MSKKVDKADMGDVTKGLKLKGPGGTAEHLGGGLMKFTPNIVGDLAKNGLDAVEKPAENILPVDPETTKPLLKGDEYLAGIMAGGGGPKFNFMAGTDKDSQYLVVALGKGLKMGVRPMMFPGKFKDNPGMVLFLAVRVRVMCADPSGSLLLAKEAFGLEGGALKGEHYSTHAALPAVYLPCSKFEAFTAIKEHALVEKFAAILTDRAVAAGADLEVTAQVLTDYLDAEYAKEVSDVHPGQPPTEVVFF